MHRTPCGQWQTSREMTWGTPGGDWKGWPGTVQMPAPMESLAARGPGASVTRVLGGLSSDQGWGAGNAPNHQQGDLCVPGDPRAVPPASASLCLPAPLRPVCHGPRLHHLKPEPPRVAPATELHAQREGTRTPCFLASTRWCSRSTPLGLRACPRVAPLPRGTLQCRPAVRPARKPRLPGAQSADTPRKGGPLYRSPCSLLGTRWGTTACAYSTPPGPSPGPHKCRHPTFHCPTAQTCLLRFPVK